ncbi:MAG: aldo/keto reductase [Phycisphaerales bacterium]|nr:MAG: aldo/keto reductase [Phycisphaerales bacterium]
MEPFVSSAESNDCRLVLGTAQLGLAYGIANTTGQLGKATAIEIVREAWDNGIREFDTAQGYGKSESVLGKVLSELGLSEKARIVSKFDPNLDHLNASVLSKSLDESLRRLGVQSLFGMMLHREEMLSLWDEGLAEILDDFVSSGRIRNVGVSVYSPDKAVQALNTEGVAMVQLPANVFDRRFENVCVFQLADEKKKKVYIRSIFLQGLLLMQPEEIPPRMAFARPVLQEFESLSNDLGLKRQEIALGYVKSQTPHAKIVLGADTPEHVRENRRCWDKNPPSSLVPTVRKYFDEVDERILNPSLWPDRCE